mgnify:CR=1 FL=1
MSMNDDIKNILVSEEALKAKVAELGAQISRDYEGRNLVLVSILKGSVVFMADLMRAVTIPCSIDFMVVSSYGGSNTTTSGLVKIIKDLDGDLSGKDVLIVEDILDTGVTLSKLVPMLKMRIMEKCGLASYFIHRYPHQFSGGQRQRIGIARSLAVHPKFVVCDEAVSALDVSIQSQIINLLLDLKEQNNLTYLFISHDLSVIKYISDRIGVMYLGNMMELSDTEHLFAHPYHPYTEALLSAIPTTDVDGRKETIILEGDIPSPINPPKGCKFHTRCRYCTEICKNVTPQFEEVEPGHFVACHHKLGVPEEK